MDAIAEATTALEGCRRILVFTGAGISTESGIPDFRGPNGVWKTVDPKQFTLRHYIADAEFRKQRWSRWFGEDRPHFRPNPAHHAVAELWKTDRMVGCVTQNIDGLHLDGGLPESALAEVHGNTRAIACLDHGHRHEVATIRERWRNGDLDPHCHCGAILKSTVVLFGEQLPEAATEQARNFSMQADAAVAVGSTISVFPAADYVLAVADRNRPLIILNLGPTDADELATIKLEGKAGEILPKLVAGLQSQPL